VKPKAKLKLHVDAT